MYSKCFQSEKHIRIRFDIFFLQAIPLREVGIQLRIQRVLQSKKVIYLVQKYFYKQNMFQNSFLRQYSLIKDLGTFAFYYQ